MTALMWFRTDLRTDDNTALLHALEQHRRVGAIYYATPEQWRDHEMAPAKGEFIWRTLEVLRDDLAKLRVPLWVRVVPRYTDIADDLAQFATEQNVDAVFANREYPVNEIARDAAVAHALSLHGIGLQRFHDATLLPPGTVRTQQGQPFKVFTPFKRSLLVLIGGDAVQCQQPKPAEFWCDAPTLPSYPYRHSALSPQLWPAGETVARKRLSNFAREHLDAYHEQRDFPAAPGTSQLSPYLALGVISIRRCMEAAFAPSKQVAALGAQTWISELIWREFYINVIEAFPQLCKYKPMRPETESVPWRHDDAEFQRWCEGRTGFPLVDAAMRQLVQTGWMHNRLRMVAAMFLCKYLLIDWRKGEQFFMQHLIDGDLAANNGGWQWSASTGTDAVPYFRLLSPVRQAERFDADGEFIRRFVPELKDVDSRWLHKPGSAPLLATGYPAPMVDVKMARLRALSAFSNTSRAMAGDDIGSDFDKDVGQEERQ